MLGLGLRFAGFRVEVFKLNYMLIRSMEEILRRLKPFKYLELQYFRDPGGASFPPPTVLVACFEASSLLQPEPAYAGNMKKYKPVFLYPTCHTPDQIRCLMKYTEVLSVQSFPARAWYLVFGGFYRVYDDCAGLDLRRLSSIHIKLNASHSPD